MMNVAATVRLVPSAIWFLGRAPMRAAVIDPVVHPSVQRRSAMPTTRTPSSNPTWSWSGRYVSAPRNATPAPKAATFAAIELAVWVKTGCAVRRSWKKKAAAGRSASGASASGGSQCLVSARSTATTSPSSTGPAMLKRASFTGRRTG